MKVIKTNFFLLFCLFALSLKAQDNGSITITGSVTDSQGHPLTGVTIVDKSRPSVGTVSNIDGEYRISIENGTTLEFSYVGFTS